MTTRRKTAVIEVAQPIVEQQAVAPVEVALVPVFAEAIVVTVQAAAASLLALPITNESTLEEKLALDKVLKEASKTRNEFGKVRLSYTRELDAKKKEVMALEDEIAGPLDTALNASKVAVDSWNREQFRKQQAAAQTERDRIAQLAITQAASTRSETKTTAIIENALQQAAAIPAPVLVPGTRLVKLFEVTNPELVPSEYLVVDETKIRAAITAGKLLIPGVKIWEDVERTGR
jgi:hypothetical protein